MNSKTRCRRGPTEILWLFICRWVRENNQSNKTLECRNFEHGTVSQRQHGNMLFYWIVNQSPCSFQVHKLLCGKAKINFLKRHMAGAERLSHLYRRLSCFISNLSSSPVLPEGGWVGLKFTFHVLLANIIMLRGCSR